MWLKVTFFSIYSIYSASIPSVTWAVGNTSKMYTRVWYSTDRGPASPGGIKATDGCDWFCKFGGPVGLARKLCNPNLAKQSRFKTGIHCIDIYFCS